MKDIIAFIEENVNGKTLSTKELVYERKVVNNCAIGSNWRFVLVPDM